MRLGLSAWAAIAMAVAGTTMVGCSGAEEPLGGPYGGTATNVPAPTHNSSGGTSGSSDTSGTGTSSGGTTSSSSSSSSSGGGTTSSSSSGGGTTSSSSSSGGSSSGGTAAPTWSQLYKNYLAGGTEGSCSQCHSGTGSASGLYSWLQGKGYVGGSSPALTDPNQSCLSWYGGNMPPNGPNDAQAVSDMNAWAAAGGQNN